MYIYKYPYFQVSSNIIIYTADCYDFGKFVIYNTSLTDLTNQLFIYTTLKIFRLSKHIVDLLNLLILD